MTASPKPVTILTGFLGAGKTTYLNHLLQQNPDTRYAIIENEFGQQGIDGDLVIRPEENIVELNSGCLCCTLNDNLYDIINDLFDRRDKYDEIIIEATGVADPTGLAQPFLIQPAIKKQFPLQGIICLVDAELIEDQLVETEEAKNQVAYSDLLLINKIDLVAPHYLQELTQRLKQLNPLASIAQGRKGAFPMVEFQNEQSPLEKLFQHNNQPNSPDAQQFPVPRPHSHHHHHHTEEMVSETFHFDQAFDIEMLNMHLLAYLMFQSKGLYRMKGLVWIQGSNQQHIVQSVGKRLNIETGADWFPEENKRSVMVFIGKNLQRKGLERLLKKCLSKSITIES